MYKSLLLAGLSAGLIAGPAAAQSYGYGAGYDDDGYSRQEYNRPQYDRRDDGRQAYARVLRTQPVYQTVRVDQPRQECWNAPVSYVDPRYSNNVSAGGLIGAIAGGVIGNQFGGGAGKFAATALGAVVGANVGANAAAANTPYSVRNGYQQQCRVMNDTHYENRIAAYDVTYRYGGRDYVTRLPYDPGDHIAVDVDVQPRAY